MEALHPKSVTGWKRVAMKTIGVWLTKLAVIRQLRPTTAGII